jgi:hypothetical protein
MAGRVACPISGVAKTARGGSCKSNVKTIMGPFTCRKKVQAGGEIMEQQVPKSEKVTNLILGIFFIAIGIFFLILSFVLMPLIGFIFAIPCIGLGILFIVKHRRRLSGAGEAAEPQRQ